MHYYVRITQKSKKTRDETKVDMTREQFEERVLKPYEKGEPIIINGKTIVPNDIERIRVSRSENDFNYFKQVLKAEDANSTVMVMGGPSYEWRAADRAEDVTDEFIQGPPGYKKDEYDNIGKNEADEDGDKSMKKVFIVHGHDSALKNELEIFLRELKLMPIVLHRQADGGLTIIEKFEQYSDVRFAFILLTPDDVGFTVDQLEISEEEREIEYRARQNVIFEFGYFVAKLGRENVCSIYKENVSLPSDISGLLYKEVDESIEDVGYNLIKELKNAGLEPEL